MNINLENFTKEINHNNFIESFIKELEKGIKNMSMNMENEQKEYTIDRFEGEYAVCEDRKTGEMVNFKRENLPQNVKEGSIIKYSNGTFEIDSKLEKEVSERIKQKMDNLWNN